MDSEVCISCGLIVRKFGEVINEGPMILCGREASPSGSLVYTLACVGVGVVDVLSDWNGRNKDASFNP